MFHIPTVHQVKDHYISAVFSEEQVSWTICIPPSGQSNISDRAHSINIYRVKMNFSLSCKFLCAGRIIFWGQQSFVSFFSHATVAEGCSSIFLAVYTVFALVAVKRTRVSCSDSWNYTLKTWVLASFRFSNQAINHLLSAGFRDHTGKDSGACWSSPMSYFEQELQEEQPFMTGLNLSHTLSLFINLFFHSREFVGVVISDHNQTLLSGSHSFSLHEMLVSHTPTGFAAWAQQSPVLHQWQHTYHFWHCCWSFLLQQARRGDQTASADAWWKICWLATGFLTTSRRSFASAHRVEEHLFLAPVRKEKSPAKIVAISMIFII